eukprot:m.30639 g.30639  ORF g.30639 m.30639 type:complete len:73 (+) comp9498_c0_seq1:1126-1344(+)
MLSLVLTIWLLCVPHSFSCCDLCLMCLVVLGVPPLLPSFRFGLLPCPHWFVLSCLSPSFFFLLLLRDTNKSC